MLRAGAGGLPPLARARYAQAHAAFEAGSDQRRRVLEALTALLPGVAPRSRTTVVSVGHGPGDVDGALAARASTLWPDVRWVGVDPDPAAGRGLQGAIGRLAPTVTVATHPGAVEHWDGSEHAPVDLVLFVQCLYYVSDVPSAVRKAWALLRPGGTLVAVHAPLGALNQLPALLAPPTDGHRQWWADDVRRALLATGADVREEPVDAEVDLTDVLSAGEPGEPGDEAGGLLLDFVAQADTSGLSPAERRLAVEHLCAAGRRDARGRLLVPHPAAVLRSTRP